MTMVIALLSVSLVLTVITAIVLSSVLRAADSSAPVRETPHLTAPPRFFATDIAHPVRAAGASAVPVEVLVLEIERHVRQEREVAESFHLSPTPQALHVHAASPLMH